MSMVNVLTEVSDFFNAPHGHFINGKEQSSATAEKVATYNPATGEVLAEVPRATDADLEAAITAASESFKDKRWSGMRPADRERILMRLADLMEEHQEAIAQIETLNQGKSIHVSRAVDAGGTAEYVRYIAGWTTKITGETFDISIPAPPGQQFTSYTIRQPIGVVAAIAPWNFPLSIAAWKVMPALAAGCSVVLKPSSETPFTSLYFAQLAKEAGLPDGVLNVLLGDGAMGGKLVAHPAVRKVSFTGSTAVGIKVGQAAVEHMAHCSLELGGKNPMIIMDDVPVAKAVAGIMQGAFLNSGQVCAAASRIYIQRAIYEDVVEALSAEVSKMTVGAGLDEAAQIQPLVSKRQQASVLEHIAKAKAAGNRILTGGKAGASQGYYVEPTLIVDAKVDDDIVKNEVFGPVIVLLPFETQEEVLAAVNNSDYGLASSLWTNDVKTMLDMVPKIEAGTVWVNNHIPLDPAMPFGGVKHSGIGRDFGKASVESYTEVKSVCILH